eukprot:14416680-Heterocapsa_arctica.AAC.1
MHRLQQGSVRRSVPSQPSARLWGHAEVRPGLCHARAYGIRLQAVPARRLTSPRCRSLGAGWGRSKGLWLVGSTASSQGRAESALGSSTEAGWPSEGAGHHVRAQHAGGQGAAVVRLGGPRLRLGHGLPA